MNLLQATSAQKAVIELKTGRHLVLAPPGSGKTDILAVRLGKAVPKVALAVSGFYEICVGELSYFALILE
jgi:superfamily I DNA/RNA helicase